MKTLLALSLLASFSGSAAYATSCSGQPTACKVFFGNSSACRSQPGCTWKENNQDATQQCRGTAKKCEAAFDENACEDIQGCSWNE